nr:MAG TPA: hypothetical protein [Caudoviricetes sp.]
MPSCCYRSRFSPQRNLNVSICNRWAEKWTLTVTDRDVCGNHHKGVLCGGLSCESQYCHY